MHLTLKYISSLGWLSSKPLEEMVDITYHSIVVVFFFNQTALQGSPATFYNINDVLLEPNITFYNPITNLIIR